MKKRLECCKSFGDAQESGTDNEGYGALIFVEKDYVSIGCNLPNINYCPYCGKPIKDLFT